uniref:SCO5717 family growth-regulating ATPase n=1 Tax=Streptomyces specialis TaxID=498367 RepID=UPI00073E9CD9
MTSDRDRARTAEETSAGERPDDELLEEDSDNTGQFTIDYTPPAWYSGGGAATGGAAAPAQPAPEAPTPEPSAPEPQPAAMPEPPVPGSGDVVSGETTRFGGAARADGPRAAPPAPPPAAPPTPAPLHSPSPAPPAGSF